MRRQSSHIKLDRDLVEMHGHFPAMVLDCLRNRIEVYLAAEGHDDRYFREKSGLVYVRASGTFIANWIMCDRSTAIKALRKLSKAGVLDKAYLTGKNNGAWYAFGASFIRSSSGFFDASVKRHLIAKCKGAEASESPHNLDQTGDVPAAEMSPAGEDLIPTTGEDEILTGEDEILTGEDEILTTPIIYTKKHHPPPTRARGAGGGFFDGDFLDVRDEQYRREIAAALASYPDEDPVALAKDQLGWRTCRPQTEKQIKGMASDFGFEIFAASVVMAAAEPKLRSPLSFIRSVAERLEAQRVDHERRRPKPKPPSIPRPEPPRSGRSPSELCGGSVTDEQTWNRLRQNADRPSANGT